MIVFLTLIYVAVLALLVKFGVLKLNLFWKLSPILWMAFLLIALFVPMQWGAPSGKVNVYQYVVEITPNVTGEVIEVPVEGLTPLKKDDVLFRIDPQPYQAVVDQLTAQLENAKQNVERLKNSVVIAQSVVAKTQQQIDITKTQQASVSAGVSVAQATFNQAKADLEKSKSQLSSLDVQVASASREFDRLKSLREQNATTASDVDRAQVQYAGLTSQRDTAKLGVSIAEEGVVAAQAKLDAAQIDVLAAELSLKQLVETELPRVKASLRDAELAAGSMIGDEHTSVAAVRSQLQNAEYDLSETTVRAPSDGYVVANTLRPGQRVANLPFRSAMTFIDSKQTRLAVGINQYAMRHVEPGQRVEVTLKLHPGKVLTGMVEKIAWVTPQGQLAPSGHVPGAPTANQPAIPFGVVIQLNEDESIDIGNLPGGAVGSAAIYTNQVKSTHLIRRVMIRMDAWTNYVNPF